MSIPEFSAGGHGGTGVCWNEQQVPARKVFISPDKPRKEILLRILSFFSRKCAVIKIQKWKSICAAFPAPTGCEV